MIDDTSIGNDGMVDFGAIDLRGRQKPRARKHRRAHVEKVEARQFRGHVDIGVEKGADGPDVLPITLEDIGEDAEVRDGRGNDMLAEVVPLLSRLVFLLLQEPSEHFAVEHVNAHGGEVELLLPFDIELFVHLALDL